MDEYFNLNDWGFAEEYLPSWARRGKEHPTTVEEVETTLIQTINGSFVDGDSSCAYFLIDIDTENVIIGPSGGGAIRFLQDTDEEEFIQ